MTLEELKAEAKKHGYKLTKEYPYIPLAPCVCGRRGGNMGFNWGNKAEYYYHKCYHCGFASQGAKTKHEAKLKWNECVERVKALEYITSDIDTLIDARKE